MQGLMQGAVRMIIIRFAFSNPKLVPRCLRQKAVALVATPSEFLARHSEARRGGEIILPVNEVGCALFLDDLTQTGYTLVDAFFQAPEETEKDYYVARFDFIHSPYLDASAEFQKEARQKAEEVLRQLLEQNMWRVRTFLNLFFQNGESVEGCFALSVNLGSRVPLVDKNGKTIVQWQKDQEGKRIGLGPVPLKPHRFLRIEAGGLVVK